MCGRFSLYASDDDLVKLFDIDVMEGEHGASYNQAPSQWIRSVVGDQPRVLTLQKWGLVPHWAKDNFRPLINARAETLTEKPAFRAAAMRRRCLLPANGYYEWSDKQPYFLSEGGAVQGMAGIYETYYLSDGSPIITCAIITRAATDSLGHIHDRMPVFVPPDMWQEWLDPQLQDRRDVQALLDSVPAAHPAARPVNPAVGNVRTEDPDVIFDWPQTLDV